MSKKGEGKGIAWIRENANHDGVECLIWPMSRRDNGYGALGYNGMLYYAHRLMCEEAHGPAPSTRHLAAHSCGKGHEGCVNPNHLSWKTARENQIDRIAHGTSGRRSYWSRTHKKLTPQQQNEVKALKGHLSQRKIASLYGISYQQVSLIQRGLDRQPKRAS